MAGWIKIALGIEVDRELGTQLPAPKRGQSPPFSAHFYCGQTAGCTKMPLGMEVGLGAGDFVLDGDPASPSPNRAPNFAAHVCCVQTARWIKMPLDTEVGLGPVDVVLDRDSAPTPQKGTSPIFGPCLLWPNGCMYRDTTWYGGRPKPRRHCVRWGPSSPFPPMSIVAKRLDGLRCHLVWRYASAQATLCSVENEVPPEKWAQPPPSF